MQKGNEFRVHVRRVFKRIFYVLFDQLKIRRLRYHFSAHFYRSAIVADFGAHREQFFAALKSNYSISRALLVEANPALGDPLKKHSPGLMFFTRH